MKSIIKRVSELGVAVIACCLMANQPLMAGDHSRQQALSQQLSSDTIVNLIQWDSASGGNDHWYAVIALTMQWIDHNALAPTLQQSGMSGYLATVTSPAEDDFIFSQVISGLNPNAIADEFYLGGQLVDGSWDWLTGEQFAYQNWAPGEPSGQAAETALAIWGDSNPAPMPGKWNNVPPDTSTGGHHMIWSVIEWGEPDTGVYVPDTLVNLVQWPVSQGGNDHWYAVIALTMQWIDHNALAPTLQQSGMSGYLATVTSPAEDDFIFSQVISGLDPDAIADEFYLGGQLVDGSWDWLTGEQFGYQNWAPGEPSGYEAETILAMWGDSNPLPLPGKWNDAPPDTSTGNWHMLWSVIEWGEPDTSVYVPDTLVNLVQWPVSQGGNDHWYAVIALTMQWIDHNALAPTLQQSGMSGYLATVTSPAEDNFIFSQVISGLNPNAIADEFYLGSRLIDSSWHWLTGEQFAYQNWAPGEPSGQAAETALAIWGDSNPAPMPGKWNNVPPDTSTGNWHMLWSVIEWGEPDTSVYVPDTLVNLVQWPVSQGGNDHWYAVIALTMQWIDHNALAPTLQQSGMSGYLATVTSAAENDFVFSQVISGLNPNAIADEFYLGSRLIDSSWRWLTGEQFAYQNWAPGEPSGQAAETALAIWGDSNPAPLPGKWNNVPPDTSTGGHHMIWSVIEWGEPEIGTPGDFDGVPGVTVSDLTFMVAYMFLGGPPPCNLNLMDVNGDCAGPNIGDLTYLIAYLFQGGEALRPGCILSSPSRVARGGASVSITADYADGATTVYLESQISLRGLQLELVGTDDGLPQMLAGDELDLVYGRVDGVVKVGIVDLDGSAMISPGVTSVLRLEGEYEVISAVASTVDHQSVRLSITSRGGTALPADYALHQNYPNPFNPTTEISYHLPAPSEVRFEVFNLLGRWVTTLVDDHRDAGTHTITWHGTNSHGKPVSSGVYLYRLEAGTFSETKKMMLVK